MQGATGWVNPYPLPTNNMLNNVFDSLSQWLAGAIVLPFFPGGIALGNGVPGTFNPSTGAQTSSAFATLAAGTIDTANAFQGGTFSATINSGSSSTSGSVAFAQAFPTACDRVMLNIDDSSISFGAHAYGYTASGFSYVVFQTAGTNLGANHTFSIDYLAQGS